MRKVEIDMGHGLYKTVEVDENSIVVKKNTEKKLGEKKWQEQVNEWYGLK